MDVDFYQLSELKIDMCCKFIADVAVFDNTLAISEVDTGFLHFVSLPDSSKARRVNLKERVGAITYSHSGELFAAKLGDTGVSRLRPDGLGRQCFAFPGEVNRLLWSGTSLVGYVGGTVIAVRSLDQEPFDLTIPSHRSDLRVDAGAVAASAEQIYLAFSFFPYTIMSAQLKPFARFQPIVRFESEEPVLKAPMLAPALLDLCYCERFDCMVVLKAPSPKGQWIDILSSGGALIDSIQLDIHVRWPFTRLAFDRQLDQLSVIGTLYKTPSLIVRTYRLSHR